MAQIKLKKMDYRSGIQKIKIRIHIFSYHCWIINGYLVVF